jgi:hypothetical protein
MGTVPAFSEGQSMAVNSDKRDRWQDDTRYSVAQYNDWFLTFAPETFSRVRATTAVRVKELLERTNFLRSITIAELRQQPGILQALRMCTAPPIARDRLVGLANVSKSLVMSMEEGRPPSTIFSNKREMQPACLKNSGDSSLSVVPLLQANRDPLSVSHFAWRLQLICVARLFRMVPTASPRA